MTQPTRWTPSDYLLRNEFCPPAQIQADLEALRQQSNAQWLILVAFDQTIILKNLTFVSAADPGRRRDLHEALTGASASFRDSDPMLDVTAEDVVALVREKTGAASEQDIFGARLPRHRVSEQSISYCLVSDCRIAADAALVLGSAPFADMLNGTSIANVRRDQRIFRLVQKAAPEVRSHQSGISSAGVLRLVELAATVVNADVGYYVLDRSARQLRLAQTSADALIGFPSYVPLDSGDEDHNSHEAIVAEYARLSFQDAATRIYPPPTVNLVQVQVQAQAHDEGARSSWAPAVEQTLVCLVIPYAPAGNRVLNIGVLVVRRSRDVGGAEFTMFELALLRNVVLRLSLLSSLLRAQEFATKLSSFGGALSAYRVDPVHFKDERLDATGVVPWDIHLSRALLRTLLKEVARSTQSSSATFRALTVASRKSHGGLVLRRFISLGAGSVDDDFVDLPLYGRDAEGAPMVTVSANVNAAVTGRPVHIWNLKKPLRLQNPGLTRVVQVSGRPAVGSELCFPVRCGETLVGTMNLESPLEGAYLTDIEVIAAFAALAGAAIAATRDRIIREMVQRSASLRIGPHEARNIRKVLDLLQTRVKPTDMELLDELERLALRPGRKEQASDGLTVLDMSQLLHELRQDLGFAALRVYAPSHAMLTTRSGESIRAALMELLKNQMRHANAESGFPPSTTISGVRLAGRDYLQVLLRNTTKQLLTTEFLSRAYNYPLYNNASSRASLGCFTAGNHIREAGGSVYMAHSGFEGLETVMLLPISTDGAL